MSESNRGFPAPSNREAKETKIEVDNLGSGAKAPDLSSVKVVTPTTSGVEVVALRAGYFNHSRRVEGDKFIVPSLDKVGTWMKCTDPKTEELRKKKRAELK